MKQIRPIVPVEQWCEDPFYLGPTAGHLRPYQKDALFEFCNSRDKRKIIFTGSSRSGKSFLMRVIVIRIAYEISCFDSFPTLYNLDESTLPQIIWFAFTKGKSNSTGIGALIRMIDKIPYFQDPTVKRRDLNSEIVFPFLRIVSGSQVTDAIGEDLLGAILDEANVRKVAKGSEVENAQGMFKEIRQRSQMTFSRNGVWGGFSAIISSATTSSSFTAQELEKAKKKGDTVIMEISVYAANPSQYSKETFDVFKGSPEIPPFIVDQADEVIRSRIATNYGITLEEYLQNNPDLIEPVPVSIRENYEEDISFALANMSGITQSGTNLYITNKKWITNMWNEERVVYDVPNLGIFDTVPVEIYTEMTKNLENYAGENVYIHVDPSQKWDHTGFSALYYSAAEKKIKTLLTAEFTIDHGKPDNQIDQEKLFQFIVFLKDNGARIKFVSGDHYAKDYLIPQCKMLLGNGCSDYFSVDTSNVAYDTALNYVKRGMYSLPYYNQMKVELEELWKDFATGKVDHQANSNPNKPVHFKDVCDGWAAASFHIYTRESIRYDEQDIEKQAEKIDEESDGFYDDLSTEEEEEWKDEKEEWIGDLESSLIDD